MTTAVIEEKAAKRVIRTVDSAIKHINREVARQQARIAQVQRRFLNLVDQEEVSNGNSTRFHFRDLVPVLKRIHGEFTVDDLLEKAEKMGVEVSHRQAYSAIINLDNVQKVKSGAGRSKAIFIVKK